MRSSISREDATSASSSITGAVESCRLTECLGTDSSPYVRSTECLVCTPYSPPPRIKKKRKKVSLKAWLVPLAILVGCLLLVPMAWLGYRGVQALAGGKLAVPLLSDSHDKIFAEMNAGLEQSILPGTAGPAVMVDAAAIRKSMEENSARMEKWMLRAIALGPATREQFAAYKAKRDLAMEKFKADFARRIEEMKNAPPPKMPDPSAGGFELTGESAWHNQINRVAGLYFQKAVADTPPSTNENETRMHKESLLLREMLKVLASIQSKEDGEKAVERLEKIADELLAIAVDRSSKRELPAGGPARPEFQEILSGIVETAGFFWEKVQRSNWESDNLKLALNDARNAHFTISIATQHSPEELEKNYTSQRKLKSAASGGGVAKTEPPKSENKPSVTTPSKTDAVAKTSNAAKESAKEASSTERQANDKANSSASAQPADPALASSDPRRIGPPAGMMPPGFGPPTGFGPPPGFGPGRGAPGGGQPNPGFPGQFPSAGPPPGNGGGSNLLDAYANANGVRIYLENGSIDIDQTARDLAHRLGTNSYSSLTNNGKQSMGLSYSGSLEKVRQAIQFGKIVRTDEENRIIYVRVP